ncbi:hypothetical protein E4P82_00030 [Candidatus Competibacter phosphatis]|uniref:Uncharacterized protein n=1 Tax=Candidatus Competibacter phosphatis TaxID=221280 RepID=A0ABX1TG64_9GAMM|nr:hypothetical protein [Candidatus Competibacter phosphatis]NMQ17731.1 hypothetical protein [Candidatus Competibacter phosphatis]
MGHPRWEYLDWEDNQSDQATGTRIRLMFPYHLPASDPPLPLDPPLDSSLVRAHELAALVETTLVNRLMTDDNPRNRLTVRGIAVDDMMVCMKMQLAHAWIGTWLWVDLRGAAAPRLTVDRKTAILREDIQDWPSLFEGVFQRWCDYLQRLLNQYSLQIASGLLSVLGIDAALHPKAPITPQLSRWKLEITDRSVAWHGQWLTALLIQEMVIFNDQFQQAGSGIFHTINTLSLISKHASNLNRDRTLDRALALTLARTITRTLNPARITALLHDNNSYLDLDPVLRLDF